MCVRLWKAGPVSLTLQVVDGEERRCDFSLKRAGDEIKDFLEGWGGVSEKHLLSLDGYLEGSPEHDNLLSVCMLWRRHDMENRRLVVTTSMGARIKVYSEQDMIERIKEMKVYSWMLEEYKEAVKHDLLYKTVANMVGSSLGTRNAMRKQETEQERRAREVESKYQIVGGSCRYMFQYTTAEAIEQLHFAMASVDNFEMLMDLKTGDRAKRMVNRLHAMYRVRCFAVPCIPRVAGTVEGTEGVLAGRDTRVAGVDARPSGTRPRRNTRGRRAPTLAYRCRCRSQRCSESTSAGHGVHKEFPRSDL